MTSHYDLYYTAPSGKIIPVKTAKKFMDRIIGLSGHKKEIYGILMESCCFTHTFFMRYPVDIIYLDKNNKVIATKRCIKPFRIVFPVRGAKRILKFPSSLNAMAFLKKGTPVELFQTKIPLVIY